MSKENTKKKGVIHMNEWTLWLIGVGVFIKVVGFMLIAGAAIYCTKRLFKSRREKKNAKLLEN